MTLQGRWLLQDKTILVDSLLTLDLTHFALKFLHSQKILIFP